MRGISFFFCVLKNTLGNNFIVLYQDWGVVLDTAYLWIIHIMILIFFHLTLCRYFQAWVEKGSCNLEVVAVQTEVERSEIAADLQMEEMLEQKTHMERSAAANWCFRTGWD